MKLTKFLIIFYATFCLSNFYTFSDNQNQKTDEIANSVFLYLKEQNPDAKKIGVAVENYGADIPYVQCQCFVVNKNDEHTYQFQKVDWTKQISNTNVQMIHVSQENLDTFFKSIPISAYNPEFPTNPYRSTIEYVAPPSSNPNSTNSIFYYQQPLPPKPIFENNGFKSQLSITPIQVQHSQPKDIALTEMSMLDFTDELKEKIQNLSEAELTNFLIAEWNEYAHKAYSCFEEFVLTHFNLYQFDNFKNYIKGFENRDEFVLNINKLITDKEKGKQLRSNLNNIPGFGKNKFQKLIQSWAQEINEQRNPALKLERMLNEESKKLHKECKKRQAQWFKNEIEKLKTKEKQKKTISKQSLLEEITKLQEFKKIFKAAKKEFPQISEEYELAELGIQFTNKSKLELENKNFNKFKFYQKRALTLLKALQNPHLKDKTFDLNEHTKIYAPNHNLNLEHLNKSFGDSAQNNIHEELVNVVNDTSDLLYAFADNFHINNIASVIYQSINQALKTIDNKEYGYSYALSDFCYGMFNVGKTIALGFAKGLERGVTHFSESCEKLINKLVDHPIDTTTDMIGALRNTIYYTTTALSKAARFALDNPHIAYNNSKDFISNLWQKIKDSSPEEAVTNSVAFITELTLSSLPTSAAFSKLSELSSTAKTFSIIAKNEIQYAASVNENIKKFVTPVKTVFDGASKTLKIAAEKGTQITKELVDLISDQPALATVHGSFETALEESAKHYDDFKKYSDKVAKFYKGQPKEVVNSIKGRLKKEGLPTKGKIRFVPSKKAKLTNFVEDFKIPHSKPAAFKDKFGNIWQQGSPRTVGENFEWDMQLSKTGVNQLGWASKDKKHLNISLKGRITH